MYQFTTRGVPVTYYGEEIGDVEVDIPAIEARRSHRTSLQMGTKTYG